MNTQLLDVLARQGVLLNVSVRYWRAAKKLRAEDLGLDPDTVTDELISLGHKKLVPPEALKRFALIESRAHALVDASTFPFLGALPGLCGDFPWVQTESCPVLPNAFPIVASFVASFVGLFLPPETSADFHLEWNVLWVDFMVWILVMKSHDRAGFRQSSRQSSRQRFGEQQRHQRRIPTQPEAPPSVRVSRSG